LYRPSDPSNPGFLVHVVRNSESASESVWIQIRIKVVCYPDPNGSELGYKIFVKNIKMYNTGIDYNLFYIINWERIYYALLLVNSVLRICIGFYTDSDKLNAEPRGNKPNKKLSDKSLDERFVTIGIFHNIL